MRTHELVAAIEAKWSGVKVLHMILDKQLVPINKTSMHPVAMHMVRGFAQSLEGPSHPYLWSPQPFADVNRAAELIDVEHHRFKRSDAYTEHGFFYFPHASIYSVEQTTRGPGETELRALSWFPVQALWDEKKGEPSFSPRPGTAFCLWVEIQRGGMGVIVPHFYMVCPDGEPIGNMRAYRFGPDLADIGKQEWSNAVFAMQFWVSAQHWLQQNILVAQSTPTPRAARRRLQRDGKPVGDLLVVEMRRRQQKPREPGDEGSRDYHCRWIVHEHIRNQWYPSKGQHFPIPIGEYVAGPEDKPLVIKERVFNVKR